jgi:hypothetical protein
MIRKTVTGSAAAKGSTLTSAIRDLRPGDRRQRRPDPGLAPSIPASGRAWGLNKTVRHGPSRLVAALQGSRRGAGHLTARPYRGVQALAEAARKAGLEF